MAYAFSWLCWSPYLLPGFPVSWQTSSFLHYLGLLGPLVAALFWTGRAEKTGLGALLRSMLIPRGSALYWLVVPLLPFLLLTGCAWIATQGQLSTLDWSGIWRSHELQTIRPLAFVALNVFVVGFGEETGWRGYALPRLQSRYSALTSTLLLTIGWAIWHWPLFFYVNSGYHTMNMAGLFGWLISLVTGAILFTWLFNSSRGSVLACALFHASMDMAFMADLGKPELMNYIGMAVTVGGIAIVVFCKPTHLSRRTRLTKR
ncbi:CPBP family intramembrane glutamic endopeptidase [Larkinella sp. VNQ87]|uniref:CPBP family intramembrane glutamic endopeptidase n=1 Tax=Larkinella sp. VNQ87 TaxID=3400921 RepID=UPI003C0A50E4